MVWMGVYSQSFLAPVGKITAVVLDQTTRNVPTSVQIPAQSHSAEVANVR